MKFKCSLLFNVKQFNVSTLRAISLIIEVKNIYLSWLSIGTTLQICSRVHQYKCNERRWSNTLLWKHKGNCWALYSFGTRLRRLLEVCHQTYDQSWESPSSYMQDGTGFRRSEYTNLDGCFPLLIFIYYSLYIINGIPCSYSCHAVRQKYEWHFKFVNP